VCFYHEELEGENMKIMKKKKRKAKERENKKEKIKKDIRINCNG
jgi:hypothetical protein